MITAELDTEIKYDITEITPFQRISSLLDRNDPLFKIKARDVDGKGKVTEA